MQFSASYLNKFSSLNLNSYDNPADFVIDAMGLSDSNHSKINSTQTSGENGVGVGGVKVR